MPSAQNGSKTRVPILTVSVPCGSGASGYRDARRCELHNVGLCVSPLVEPNVITLHWESGRDSWKTYLTLSSLNLTKASVVFAFINLFYSWYCSIMPSGQSIGKALYWNIPIMAEQTILIKQSIKNYSDYANQLINQLTTCSEVSQEFLAIPIINLLGCQTVYLISKD